jgi:hypothetical protein
MRTFAKNLGGRLVAAVAALACSQALVLAQVNIVRVNGGGAAPGTVAGGGNLVDIFNAAADWWETVLVTTPYTLTITFQWGPQGGSTLAAHTLTTQGGVPNRETAGSITFDNDGSSVWFLDPTPGANNEYTSGPNFSSSDLGGGTLNTGKTFTGATGSASGRTDLYAVALHEIGHALGLSSANTSFVAENGDLDVDVTAPRPFAGSAIPTVSGAHVNIGSALMFPSIGTGLRRWPTAADALANAQISQMTDILRSYEPAGPTALNVGAGATTATLTTAPNFVSNNSGSVRGAVYFTLEVDALLNLTGIDLNTSLAAGTRMEAEFYVNTAETDVANITTGAAALAANNWQLRGRLTGLSAGPDGASVLSFDDDPSLPPGTYLVAITGSHANRYTDGTGANQTATGTALRFVGGAASNEAFRGSVFAPRVFNGTFRYRHALCGTNAVTTPPEFASNNNGGIGGGIYFQLDVGSSFGRTICGIDINTDAAAGTALTGDLYVNLVETSIAALTTGSPALPAANWCRVASLTGTSNGLNQPSPMRMATALDLPAGSYLLAFVGNMAHRYTNGTATNAVVTGAGVTFRAGAASNAPFSGAVFTPRVFNATFHVDVPAAPITNFPFQALSTSVGTGCGGAPSQTYELFGATAFDLSTRDIFFNLGTGAVTTSVTAGTAIVPPVAPDLGLGDDQNTALIPLGFTISGLCANSISVASNGYIWLGDVGIADFTESEAEFVGQGARVAAYWTDLNPAAGGSIHVDIGAGVARVTYVGVFPFGGAAPEVTTQIELRPNSIRIRYNPAGGAFATSVLTGLTNGVPPAAAPGSVDFSAGGVATRPWNSHLRMSATTRPIIGTTASFQTVGIPTGALAASVFAFGPSIPGIPLAPLTPVGCNQYHLPGPSTLAIFIGSCSGTTNVVLPNNEGLLGVQFTVQSASLGTSILTSNGVDCRIGCL